MKKVALIGTHATTKSTIVFYLAAKLKKNRVNCDILTEVARDCPLPINELTTKDAQQWIIYTSYIREIEKEHITNTNLLICDRSVLDGYVYYINAFGENQVLENFVKQKIQTYDQLWRVPISFSQLNDDGRRSTNKQFQVDIDSTFNYILNKLDIQPCSFELVEDTYKSIITDVL